MIGTQQLIAVVVSTLVGCDDKRGVHVRRRGTAARICVNTRRGQRSSGTTLTASGNPRHSNQLGICSASIVNFAFRKCQLRLAEIATTVAGGPRHVFET